MPVEDYTPTVDQVAALMRSRLKGEFDDTTTFTTATRPTATMVTELIGQAVSLVAPLVGFDLDAKFHDSARAVVILQTALLVEPGYFGEQQGGDRSAWDQWEKMLERALPALVEAIAKDVQDGDAGDGGAASEGVMPVFSFPSTCGPAIDVDGAERPVNSGLIDPGCW